VLFADLIHHYLFNAIHSGLSAGGGRGDRLWAERRQHLVHASVDDA
jgi:hypothetical protein